MTVVPGSRIPPRAIARAGCAVACLIALTSPGRGADTVADPAARAGRIDALSGTVSVHGADQTQWSVVEVERGFAPGEGLWTQPGARAKVQLGGAAIELEERTQVELANLNELDAELRLVQGCIGVAVPTIGRGESYQIDTPRGAVRLMLAGRVVIEAGAGDLPTKVTVLEGAAQVVGSESGLIVVAGQTGVVTGVDGGLSYAVRQAAARSTESAEAPPPAATPDTEAGERAPAAGEPATAPEPQPALER